MSYVVVDFESYYSTEYSLRRMTPVEYILDPRFECIGAAVCEGDNGPAQWLDAPQLPAYFQSKRHLPFISHNALFDMCVLAWRFGVRPPLMVDTMSMARATIAAYTTGVSLAKTAAHLGLGAKGNAIVNAQGLTGAMLRSNPYLWPRYVEYAVNDAELCRGIWQALRGGFPRSELVVMDLVIRMASEPSFVLDPHVLAEHAATVAAEKQALLDRCGLADRSSLMSNEKFAQALEALGVAPPTKISKTTGETTYAFAKTDQAMTDLEEHDDPQVQALASARLGLKSTLEETRTARFQQIANLDWQGQARPLSMPLPLRYSGAHTHRLSGDWGLNVQNLPRGGRLRQALKAPDGYKVVAGDASQIEARINAVVCGQEDLVQDFRNGVDVYSKFASEEVYHRPIDKKSDPAGRFVGKTCLAEGTLVITDRGAIPIERVTTEHRVWDGEEWVCHKGLANNGFKKTLRLCGVSLTPDHLVLCGTRWLEAQQLAQDAKALTRALATASGKLPSQDTFEVTPKLWSRSSSGARAAGQSTRSTTGTSRRSEARAATYAPKRLRTPSGTGATQKPSQTTLIGGGCSTGWLRLSSGATTLRTKTFTTTEHAASLSATSGAGTARRSCGSLRRWTGGTCRPMKWTASTSTAGTPRVTSGSCQGPSTSGTNGASKTSNRRLRVYDICSAGPRHRFMILTDQGPMIVHNCILSLGYQSGWSTFKNMIRVQSRSQLKQELILPDGEAQAIVQAYRRRYARIAQAWRTLQSVLPLLAHQDSGWRFGPMTFRHQRVEGPGGLNLYYHDLRQEVLDGQTRWRFTFQGKRKDLYGGKLLENFIQHLARLSNMDAAVRIAALVGRDAARWALQVHDELVYVVPDSLAEQFAPLLERELSRPPAWAPDAPLAAEVGIGQAYGNAK